MLLRRGAPSGRRYADVEPRGRGSNSGRGADTDAGCRRGCCGGLMSARGPMPRVLRIPSAIVVTLAAAALQGCGPETCFHTYTTSGMATNATCVDDAGCYAYTDDAGRPLFTDCPSADACAVSVRTYPDGGTGTGGNYC